MQIYRGMDIGTAKVPEEDRQVPHYGLDIADPGEPYSAALFQDYARNAFKDIEGRGKVPILCGGTGFYIRAAIDDYRFPKGEQEDNPVRKLYEEKLEDLGPQGLWRLLEERDPASASIIHPNNSKRVIRAFELLESGTDYATQADNLKNIEQVYPACMICISIDRDILNERISDRIDNMRETGLIEEVEGLLGKGFREGLTASQAIGYKEIVRALDGEITMDAAFDDIKTATRRYAKRQRSWFRADKRYRRIDGNDGDIDSMLEQSMAILDTFKEEEDIEKGTGCD